MAAVTQSQRSAARVVGAAYVSALVLSVFAELYAFPHAQNAQSAIANQTLFRLGVAANLLTFALDVALIAALFVVLAPVNQNFALAAALWRVVETVILVVSALHDFDTLRILSGVEYLRPFEADRLQALARLSAGAHAAAYGLSFLFFGCGSTLFGWLWLRSGYVPRALAAWGIFASLLVGIRALAVVVFPGVRAAIPLAVWAAPIMAFEVTIGLWLLLKGLRPGAAATDTSEGSRLTGRL